MALVDLVPLFAAFALFVVAYLMLHGYRLTFGALMQWLAHLLNRSILGTHPFGFLASAIEDVDNSIRAGLGNAMIGSQWAWAKLMHAHAVLWHDLTGATADLAEAVQRRLEHLPRAIIQTIVPGWVYPLRTTVHYLQRLLARLERTATHAVNTVTHVVVHDLPRVTINLPKQVKVEVHKAGASVVRIVHVAFPGIGTLQRDVTGLERWVRSHGKQLTEAGAVGLLVAALSKVGINYTRCSNSKQWGNRVCAMDKDLLDSLIADSLLVLGTVSLVEFAEGMQTVVKDGAGTVREFWRA